MNGFRRIRFVAPAIMLGLAVTAWVQTTAPPLPAVFPAGALLTVEAQDFGRQWADWQGSAEKTAWLASENYAVFSRSKLFIRLKQAQDEITAAAGLPTLDTAALVTAIAGERSALAIYDIGELRFLYATEMTRANAIRNALWQARADFELRGAAGQEFFVRRSAETGRELAFAATDDRFLLSTSAELLAGALERINGADEPSVVSEAWYSDAVAESSGRGDVRLVYNLRTLVRTPYFRSYWVHQNITELSAFRAGLVDIDRGAGEISERRVLLRAEPMPAAEGAPAAELLRLAPDSAGFVRASAKPSPEDAITLLREKLLAPNRSGGGRYDYAPNLPSGAGVAGSESQLETRIDQPPPQLQRAEFDGGPLGGLFAAQGLQAALLVHQGGADGPWPSHTAAVALQSDADWPAGETLAEIARSASGLWTVAGIGASWAQDGEVYQMTGLKPLFAVVDGPLLVLADDRALLTAILARRLQPAVESQAAMIAEWRRAGLHGPFEALFARLEHLSSGGYGGPGRQPYLFSENIASFSEALGRVDSMRMERVERADQRRETVVYRLD